MTDLAPTERPRKGGTRVFCIAPSNHDELVHYASLQRYRVEYNWNDQLFYLAAVQGLTIGAGIPVLAGVIAVGRRRHNGHSAIGQFVVQVHGCYGDADLPEVIPFLYGAAARAAKALGYHRLISDHKLHRDILAGLGWLWRETSMVADFSRTPQEPALPEGPKDTQAIEI